MEVAQIGDYRFRPLRWRDALTAASWRYPGEYAFYDMSWIEMLVIRLGNPLARALGIAGFYAVDGVDGALAGVFSYIRHGLEDVEIGVAMRPNLTGQGQGLDYVRAGMMFGCVRYAPKRFSLLVASFNRRAQKVYERAGFVAHRTISRMTHGHPVDHIEMSCEVGSLNLHARDDSVGEA
ncbi:MAG TPA: GNAT family protein [Ktedonobacterales bacterium]|nr:GNAT family protein [Ktedonobacterales bacterium]